MKKENLLIEVLIHMFLELELEKFQSKYIAKHEKFNGEKIDENTFANEFSKVMKKRHDINHTLCFMKAFREITRYNERF